MKKVKISVIVTVYNRLEYVRNIILALINQTKQIDELILADDGSKGNIKSVIDDLINKCQFSIKHVWQEDIGFRLSRSRNNGAREATGELLVFLDQDIIFSNDFIEKIYKNCNKKRMVYTKAINSTEEERNKIQKLIKEKLNYIEIYEYTKKENSKIINKALRKDKIYNFLYSCHLKNRGGKIAGLMFALYKEDYININGFDEKYKAYGYEDDDFGNRFFGYGGKTKPLMFLRYPIHMYHPFDNSKKHDLNKEYYYKRKNKILKNKDFFCKYGYCNSIDTDKVKVSILK